MQPPTSPHTPSTPPHRTHLQDALAVGGVWQGDKDAAGHAPHHRLIQVHGAVGGRQHQHAVVLLGAQAVPVLRGAGRRWGAKGGVCV